MGEECTGETLSLVATIVCCLVLITFNMAVVNRLKVFSLNCNGIKSSAAFISSLLNDCDIALLQETWLLPNEVEMPSSLHAEVDSFSISAVDLGREILKGRPYGGVTYIWKKSISKYVTIKQYDDSRILGLSLGLEDKNILLLNVYLPTRGSGDDEDYMVYLGKLSSIIADAEEENLCIFGDFNCAPGSERYMDMAEMLSSHSMRMCDTDYLPSDTYTHVNAGSLSRTWLDHCAMSESLRECIANCAVTDDFATSDHSPINLTLEVFRIKFFPLPRFTGIDIYNV